VYGAIGDEVWLGMEKSTFDMPFHQKTHAKISARTYVAEQVDQNTSPVVSIVFAMHAL